MGEKVGTPVPIPVHSETPVGTHVPIPSTLYLYPYHSFMHLSCIGLFIQQPSRGSTVSSLSRMWGGSQPKCELLLYIWHLVRMILWHLRETTGQIWCKCDRSEAYDILHHRVCTHTMTYTILSINDSQWVSCCRSVESESLESLESEKNLQFISSHTQVHN